MCLEKKKQNDAVIGSLSSLLDQYFEKFIEKHPEILASSDFHALTVTTLERSLIKNILDKTNNNQVKTARILGVNRNTLRKKILTYNLSRSSS